jgi:cytochrome P450
MTAAPLPPLSPQAYDIAATDDTLARMVDDFQRLGDTYRVHAPGRRADTWVVHDPEDVKRILVGNHRNYTKGLGLDRVKILLGNGIMVSEGELWRRQRRLLQPLFHRRVIERFGAVIDAENDRLLARWQREAAADGIVDVTAGTSELALAIVLRALFGADLERLGGGDRHTDGAAGHPFGVLTRMPERNLEFAYRFRSLAKLVRDVLARRRACDETHDDYIAMLMAARDKDSGATMNERELVDEILTLLVAGHETTAATLNAAWWLLSRHPEAEARLAAELAPLPDAWRPDPASTGSLPWTRAVLQETLRLYPPGWLLTRRSIEADTLGGFPVPPRTDVLLSPYLVHRHPLHWDEPEAFRPERFLPGAAGTRHPYAYFPFAVGPRHCIGENFAMYEMTLHLAKIARRCRLRHIDDAPTEWEALVNLRTKNNLRFRLEAR